MKKLNFAFIGGGRITDMHAPAYRNNAKAKLYAVCDVNEETAKKRAKEWECEKYYTDYHQLLADKNIDAVEIMVPHFLHKEIVVAAAQAGKHVAVQKPMAIKIKECEEMIEVTKKAGVKFKVFENFVFYPPYVKAKELLDNGEIGEPLSIRFKLGTCGKGGWWVPLATWTQRLNKEDTGGGAAVFDDGYHKFSMAIHFFGDVEKIFAWIDRTFVHLDEPYVSVFKYKNKKIIGHMDFTFSPFATCKSKYYSADERVEIVGTKGVIWVNRCTGKLLDVPALVLFCNGKTICFEDLRCDWLASFWDSTCHFIDCILEDKEPSLTGELGKRVMQFTMAAEKSAREDREIFIDEVLE